MYENILPDDNWHWIIAVMVTPVKTLDTLVNKEPDKHPEIRKIHYESLIDRNFIKSLVWAPNLEKFMWDNRMAIYSHCKMLLK